MPQLSVRPRAQAEPEGTSSDATREISSDATEDIISSFAAEEISCVATADIHMLQQNL